MKDDSIIVFISGLNLHKTPEIVQAAYASKEARSPTPILAVFDAPLENLVRVVPYRVMKDPEGFTEVRSMLAEIRGIASDGVPKMKFDEEVWKGARGHTINATYISSTAEMVSMRLADGKTTTFAISLLAEDSQKRVAELAEAASNPAP